MPHAFADPAVTPSVKAARLLTPRLPCPTFPNP